MNSYERALTGLNGEIPDRVPSFELMIDPAVINAVIGSDDYMDFCVMKLLKQYPYMEAFTTCAA